MTSMTFISLFRYFTKVKYFNQWLIYLIDLMFSCSSTLLSLGLVSFVLAQNYTLYIYGTALFASILCSAVSFVCFKSYKGVIRHSTFTEVGRILLVTLLKIALLIPVIVYLPTILTFREILLVNLIDLFLTFFLLTFFRLTLITLYHLVLNVSNRDRLLIFGSENRTTALFGASLNDKLMYQVEGYLRFGKKGSLRIGGYKVYSVKDQLEFNRLINSRNIKAILFTDYQAIREESERLIRYCEKKKVRMLMLPTIDELREGTKTLRNLPDIRIEDLLGRDEIHINTGEIANFLKGKVVMVTGAAGSIGSELCRQLCHFGLKQLVLFDSAETPIDRKSVV